MGISFCSLVAVWTGAGNLPALERAGLYGKKKMLLLQDPSANQAIMTNSVPLIERNANVFLSNA